MRQELQFQPIDTKILITFRRWLRTKGLAAQIEFTSDDLREFIETHPEFQEHFSDPEHDFGNFMAKLKANDTVVQVGERPSKRESNHNRKIDVLRWAY